MAITWELAETFSVDRDSTEAVSLTKALSEAVAKYQNRQITLADAASDTEVDFSSEIGTCENLRIDSDQPISVKLTANTNTAMTVEYLHLTGTSFTKLFLSNSSGNTATVNITVGG